MIKYEDYIKYDTAMVITTDRGEYFSIAITPEKKFIVRPVFTLLNGEISYEKYICSSIGSISDPVDHIDATLEDDDRKRITANIIIGDHFIYKPAYHTDDISPMISEGKIVYINKLI